MQFQSCLFSDQFHGFHFAGMLANKNGVLKSLHLRLTGYNRMPAIELTEERLYLTNEAPISDTSGFYISSILFLWFLYLCCLFFTADDDAHHYVIIATLFCVRLREYRRLYKYKKC